MHAISRDLDCNINGVLYTFLYSVHMYTYIYLRYLSLHTTEVSFEPWDILECGDSFSNAGNVAGVMAGKLIELSMLKESILDAASSSEYP